MNVAEGAFAAVEKRGRWMQGLAHASGVVGSQPDHTGLVS